MLEAKNWVQTGMAIAATIALTAAMMAGTGPALAQSEGGSVNALPGYYAANWWNFSQPKGLDIDPATGQLWAVAGAVDIVFALNHGAIIQAAAGSAGTEPGEFENATAVSIWEDEVFATDFDGKAVSVFDMQGNFLRRWANGSALCGIEVFNDVVYAHAIDGNITSWALNGSFIGTTDGSASGTSVDVCFMDSLTAWGSELYVADTFNDRVAVFDLNLVWQRDIVVGGTPVAIDADASGQLWVADAGSDTVSVWTNAGVFVGSLGATGTGLGQLRYPGAIVVDPTGSTVWVGENDNARIQIFTNLDCGGDLLTFVSTSYDDEFATGDPDNFVEFAGPNDVVHLGAGDDTVRTLDGDDTVCGGEGADEIRGGGGADYLDGGPGDDTIVGQGGLDEIYGRAGNDTLDGQGAADSVFGGDDDDSIGGQNGADMLRGGAGNDVLRAQTGPDTLEGQAGDDDLRGGNGNDTLYGGPGFDKCAGNTGPNDMAQAATCETTPGVETLF